MSKKYLAYTLLVCTTLIWSVNFIIGKFAYLFEVPPLTLNFLRWTLVWVILFPFTYKEIFSNIKLIKKHIFYLTILAITSVSAFNSLVYLALNYTQAIDTVLMISIIPVFVLFLSSILGIEKRVEFLKTTLQIKKTKHSIMTKKTNIATTL